MNVFVEKKLWAYLGLVVVLSFAGLGYFGWEIYRAAPPVPERVQSADGKILFTGEEIRNGQNVWQSLGGQQLGSVWGHGAYVAPDWSADWLYRESRHLLEKWAQGEGSSFGGLGAERRAALQARLQSALRRNSYDVGSGVLTVTDERAEAIEATGAHYRALFGGDPELRKLREAYAISEDALLNSQRQRELQAFFFWAAWATVTERPGSRVTYSQNWPPDPVVGNTPAPSLYIWSIVSVLFLLSGVAIMVWKFAKARDLEAEPRASENNPLDSIRLTPSMRATFKYFWIVAVLMVFQIGLGIVTAHYGVEGQAFYGIPLAKIFPYALTRTWHTQGGIFWIATAWLGTGLFVAPLVSGRDPKGQVFGVNFLFACLLVIVAGSFVGQWFGVQQRLGYGANFWFGHQGYEYVDLGRFWQIFLFVGLFVWLTLMVRALAPALRDRNASVGQRQLTWMFVLSAAAIGLFYGAGLMWGRRTHLSMAEYWRWWVVHLWVEGFFEVFATVAIAFLFTKMGLVSAAKAANATLGAAILFLLGGILGTFHHLYFAGTPTSIMAIGASFSALEVVPLVLIGFEAYENLKLSRSTEWVASYKWVIYCFVAVAFWNFLGAGIFGFMINTPIALYYMQGLNTTPVHGHTALFGVYGMLGIGFMLFCLRSLGIYGRGEERLLRFSFWSVNVGLLVMVVLSLLPMGLAQTYASLSKGMWFARSADFMQSDAMTTLKWLRVPGDILFGAGILGIAGLVLFSRRSRTMGSDPRRLRASIGREDTVEA